MSKRAKELALKAHPSERFTSEYYADMYRSFFIEGYELAENDLIPLINQLCEAILFEWKDAADLARKILIQIKKSGGIIMDRATQKSIEWQKANRPMAIGGDAFSDIVDSYNMNPAFVAGYKEAEKDLGWHSVKESLPPIDEEVIVLTNDINGKIVPDAHKICYGHRPNPDGWDGKNIDTGKIKHYDVVTYDGWNIPGVTHWMYLPEIKEAEK